MKSRWGVLVLVVGFPLAAWLAAAGLFAVFGRAPTFTPLPVRPFTDLETALATDAPKGWELHRPPSHPGPYRMVPGGMTLGHGQGQAMTGWIKDDEGVVMEEARVESSPEYDYLVVFLETPDGPRTIAVLKATR